MNLDFEKKYPQSRDLLRLEQVSLAEDLPYDSKLRDATFALRPGDLMLVLLAPGDWDHPLADLISGLVPTESGSLRIFDHAWAEWSLDHQARARGRIGRVFEGNGWLSNLDIDENIILAQRHHTYRSEDEIRAEALGLAAQAGLHALPESRAALTPPDDLRKAEWVRAALGDPWLMLLERPGRGMDPGWMQALGTLVEQARSRGTAVVWLCESEQEWNYISSKPALKFRVEANTLREVANS